MKKRKIAIIGAGASGLYLSLLLKQQGEDVTLFERNARIGKKILTTGNGRCNLTNANLTGKDYNHPAFVEDLLKIYSVKETLSFFKTIGIETAKEENGKIFPLSFQASSVVNAFLSELDRHEIKCITNTYVKQIEKKDNHFIIKDLNNHHYQFDIVVLSTGGLAFPQTGSDGFGYQLVKPFGHHTTALRPSLVKLTLNSPYLKHLDGLKLNTTVELIVNNQVVQSETGDILFTSYGVSGPTILQMSKYALIALEDKKQPFINIKIVTTLSKEALLDRFYLLSHKTIEDSLSGIIPSRLIQPLVKDNGLDLHQEVSTLTYEELSKLTDYLLNWKWKVTGSLDYQEAQVTSGGIDLSEVSSKTLESKIVDGLYFTGEILDIDGRSGGFNLQWAWSSAGVVAKAIGERHD
ncbi:MAG: NAD(P)/FAD-dependent oxidoreductase [Candidatus Izemoplasmatales bacterium]